MNRKEDIEMDLSDLKFVPDQREVHHGEEEVDEYGDPLWLAKFYVSEEGY